MKTVSEREIFPESSLEKNTINRPKARKRYVMKISVCIDPKTLVALNGFLTSDANMYVWKNGNGSIREHIITIEECNSGITNQGMDVRFDVLLRIKEEYANDGYNNSPTNRELLEKLFDVLGIFPKQ